ncbi:hypothetical protein PGT21_018572 [Puccinia graminis f. sp. tritici]|uniref:Uncharacterized protein n=1 Tax=Puccinia graminis f. sp. tritici TaxID=56615 RepID=A0A5B0QJ02_PUCGR|nr:hypothetical protein PGT21_018572 [Puccinia graminis f. sp. tritici]
MKELTLSHWRALMEQQRKLIRYLKYTDSRNLGNQANVAPVATCCPDFKPANFQVTFHGLQAKKSSFGRADDNTKRPGVKVLKGIPTGPFFIQNHNSKLRFNRIHNDVGQRPIHFTGRVGAPIFHLGSTRHSTCLKCRLFTKTKDENRADGPPVGRPAPGSTLSGRSGRATFRKSAAQPGPN